MDLVLSTYLYLFDRRNEEMNKGEGKGDDGDKLKAEIFWGQVRETLKFSEAACGSLGEKEFQKFTSFNPGKTSGYFFVLITHLILHWLIVFQIGTLFNFQPQYNVQIGLVTISLGSRKYRS